MNKTKIKIISNPYERQINYKIYDEAEKEWINIIEEQDYDGPFKKELFNKHFFLFIINDVIDAIVNQYDDDTQKIDLYFEGTADEYKVVHSICKDSKIAKCIELQPQEKYLNNAYDILPHVIEIFNQRIKPIVEKSISEDSEKSESVKSDLAKFTDASNDIIPICVIGNYSAGKSTFINALIGNEILPSGDKAVTAHIFKIYQSKNENSAQIDFDYRGVERNIQIIDDSVFVDAKDNDSPLIGKIFEEISKVKEPGYIPRVNKALSIINGYSTSDEAESVSAMIEIHIPFNKGLWGNYEGKFVVLDTPGSNSASHADHGKVLMDAMKNMSNDLPIYVTAYDTLDTLDNEALYNSLIQSEGLDSRFTMIVVNKADRANLPRGCFSESDKDDILNQGVPKSLNARELYFVSSIMGLGAKNEGAFLDEHSNDIFGIYKPRYSDVSDRKYTQLFGYNIMPNHMQAVEFNAANEMAEKDKLFANSGLYSIERAISLFASKYSSYNKCQQSTLFLNRVILATKDEIQETTESRERNKAELEEKLERDKQEMIETIETEKSTECWQYEMAFNEVIRPILEEAKKPLTLEDLKSKEEELTKEQHEKLEMDYIKADAKKQIADVGDAFKNGFFKIGKSFNLNTIKEVGASVFKETKEAIDSNAVLFNTQREADRGAADELIKKTNKNFYNQALSAEATMDQETKVYWTNCSMAFREKLAEVVKNTTLSDKKKHELTDLIVTYRKIEFDTVENGDVFSVDEFDYLLNLGDLKLFKMDKLFLHRLSSAYKERLSEIVDKISKNIKTAYRDSFAKWQDNLVNIVRSNIVDYSPELRELQRKIDEETNHIHDLQNRQNRLQIYKEDIQAMTSWKEA